MADLSRLELDSEAIWPQGVLLVSLEPARDFERSTREHEVQAVDDDGVPLWNAIGVDKRALDPSQRGGTRGFRGTADVRVRIASHEEPQVPQAMGDGLGALVEFTDVTVDMQLRKAKCQPPAPGKRHFCGAELVQYFSATGLGPFRRRG